MAGGSLTALLQNHQHQLQYLLRLAQTLPQLALGLQAKRRLDSLLPLPLLKRVCHKFAAGRSSLKTSPRLLWGRCLCPWAMAREVVSMTCYRNIPECGPPPHQAVLGGRVWRLVLLPLLGKPCRMLPNPRCRG